MIAFRSKKVLASWALTGVATLGVFLFSLKCGNSESQTSFTPSSANRGNLSSAVSAVSLQSFLPMTPIWGIDGAISTNTPIVDAFAQDDTTTSDSRQYLASVESAMPNDRLAIIRARAAVAIEQSAKQNLEHHSGYNNNGNSGASLISGNLNARFHLSFYLEDDLYSGDPNQTGNTSITVNLYRLTGKAGEANAYKDPLVDQNNPAGPTKAFVLHYKFPASTTDNIHQHEFTLPLKGGNYYYPTTDLQPKSGNNEWLKTGDYAIAIKRDGAQSDPVYANFHVQ